MDETRQKNHHLVDQPSPIHLHPKKYCNNTYPTDQSTYYNYREGNCNLKKYRLMYSVSLELGSTPVTAEEALCLKYYV